MLAYEPLYTSGIRRLTMPNIFLPLQLYLEENRYETEEERFSIAAKVVKKRKQALVVLFSGLMSYVSR